MSYKIQSEILLLQLTEHFGKHIIAAEISSVQRVVLIVNPYTDLGEILLDISEQIFHIIDFQTYGEILIYPFGSNHTAMIKLN